jgi:cobalamin biosynthesis protein CobT
MTMDVVPDVSDEHITMFCKRASKLALSQVIDKVTVKERLSVQGDARRTEFAIDLSFYPEEEYGEEYDVQATEILAVFGARFPSTLKREIQLEMKKLDADLRSQIAQLGKGKASKEPTAGAADADADAEGGENAGDEASEHGDGDAEDAKRARQKKEQSSYESDEEGENEFDDAAIEAAYASEEEDSEADAEGDKKPGHATTLREEVKSIADLFVKTFQQASNFKFSESACSFKLEVSDFLNVEG